MEQTKKQGDSILWIEALGFSIIITLSWVTELVRLPHLIYGEPFEANWKRALLRTIVISLVWLWVHVTTKRLLKRLHYLEGFLRVCGWCRKVGHDDEWLTMEKYFSSRFDTRTTHGMCPECVQKGVDELKQKASEN